MDSSTVSTSLARVLCAGVFLGYSVWLLEAPAASHPASAGTGIVAAIYAVSLSVAMLLVERVWPNIHAQLRWRVACLALDLGIATAAVLTTGLLALPWLVWLALQAVGVIHWLGARWGLLWTVLASSISLLSVRDPSAIPTHTVAAFCIGLQATPLVASVLFGAVGSKPMPSTEGAAAYLGTISHELRSPLNVIVNAARMIDRSALSEIDRQWMTALVRSGDAVRGLVDDLLILTAGGAGKDAPVEPFHLHHVMARVKDALASYSEPRRQEVTWALQDSPLVFLGVPRHIERVLINLVVNASKYTPDKGRIHVSLHYEQTSDTRATLYFGVTDTGKGIADSHKRRIFNAFHQVSSGPARETEGFGLGLFIVKQLSDAMNGRLAVHDNPGGGTIFTWQLPLALAPSASETAVVDAQSVLAEHRQRVRPLVCAVIDDSELNRFAMQKILEAAGHTVRLCDDGETGLACIQEGGVDVAFLDLHMPRISGWDVLRELQRSPPPHPTPRVVVLSATADTNAAAAVRAAGAAGFVSKPVEVAALLATVEALAAR